MLTMIFRRVIVSVGGSLLEEWSLKCHISATKVVCTVLPHYTLQFVHLVGIMILCTVHTFCWDQQFPSDCHGNLVSE